jgi:hypothetical protein
MPDRDAPPPNSSARGGPHSQDPLVADQARDRNAMHRQGDMQATPETDDQHRAVAEATGNATRAEEAAGRSPDLNNRPDAQRAFQESRGDRRERDGRVE